MPTHPGRHIALVSAIGLAALGTVGCGTAQHPASTANTPSTSSSASAGTPNPIDQACAAANPALAKMQQVFAGLSKVTNNTEAAEIAVSAARQGEELLRSVAKVALDYNDTDLAAPDSSLISSFADATLKEAGALEGVAGALSVGLQAHQPGSPSLAKLAASNLRFASQQAATRKQVARQLGLTDCAY